MITAYDFAALNNPGQGYSFGVDRERVARELRRLANALDAGQVLVSGVTAVSKATAQDFTETRLLIRLTEKHEPGA